MQPKIILDTNLLISALMFANSPASQAVVNAYRYFQPIASTETWDEFEQVSAREKFAPYFSLEARLEFLATLAQSTVFFAVNTQVTDCKDPKDNQFLSLALSTDCQLIVSGDQDLVSMHPYQHVHILRPRDFLNFLSSSR